MTREEAIQYLESWLEEEMTAGFDEDTYRIKSLRMAISALSAEPIRCKDCKYAYVVMTDSNGQMTKCCNRFSIMRYVGDDSHCSWAERRE